MKKTIFVILFFSVCLSKAETVEYKKILIANITIAKNIDSISEYKAMAALTYATMLTDKYRIINNKLIDSITEFAKKGGEKLSAKQIAERLGADYILFESINKFQNMLRLEIALRDVKNEKDKKSGIGYGLLNYRKIKNDLPLYDPIILKATQRALALAFGDSLLYQNVKDKKLQVYPAFATIIGGIEYEDNSRYPNWRMFQDKVLSSYDGCEVMFEESKDSPTLAVYDLASRDSIFTRFKLYGFENYNAANITELAVLEKFDVRYYICGKLERNEEGALFVAYLLEINKSKVNIVKSDGEQILEDSTDKFREAIRKATQRLVGKQQSKND
jgi:hypothetical protein